MPRDKFLYVLLVSVLATVLTGCSPETETIPAAQAALPAKNAAAGDNCLPPLDVTHSVSSSLNLHREVLVEGGSYLMGSNTRYPEEAPAHSKQVEGFWIDIHEVTNRQFAAFVEETGYVTTAERIPLAAHYPDIAPDKLVAGSALFVAPVDLKPGAAQGHWTQWWQFVPGASWRHPQGPQSSVQGLDHHPVVHVSYLDAKAYVDWLGRSLPTEAQWEMAAQASGRLSSPGNVSVDEGIGLTANTWQGFFPLQDKALDGFAGTAPVGCYPADASGLHDMIGNVWEWVSDVYQPGHHVASKDLADQNNTADALVTVRVIKGGSHLCARNYCRRDAPQSRQPQEEDFGAGHLGFRTVRNINSVTGG